MLGRGVQQSLIVVGGGLRSVEAALAEELRFAQ